MVKIGNLKKRRFYRVILLGINPTTNHIFVADGRNFDIYVIDGLSNTIIDNIQGNIVPFKVAVNHQTNMVYIMEGDTSTNITIIRDEFTVSNTPIPTESPTPIGHTRNK